MSIKVGETTIVSTKNSNGSKGGLYEVYPERNGKNFEELFGTTNSVTDKGVTLSDAIIIAEATERFPIESLGTIAKKYFIVKKK